MYDEFGLQEKGIDSFDDFNEVYHAINDKLWARFRSGFLSREELRWKRMWQTLVHYRIPNIDTAKQMSERYLEILPTQNAVFPYAIEALQYCQAKGYEMHLITNGFEATQHAKLKHSSMDIYFDKMITSEQAMSMKPHKEIFEYAMQETNTKAIESLMIGDALDIDILGAQQVNMDQVYFNPNENLHSQKPTYEIKSLLDLKSIL
jgi:putative hydrolase of the HAD superfamily